MRSNLGLAISRCGYTKRAMNHDYSESEPVPVLIDRFNNYEEYLQNIEATHDNEVAEKDNVVRSRAQLLGELVDRFSVAETADLLGIHPRAVEEGLRQNPSLE